MQIHADMTAIVDKKKDNHLMTMHTLNTRESIWYENQTIPEFQRHANSFTEEEDDYD